MTVAVVLLLLAPTAAMAAGPDADGGGARAPTIFVEPGLEYVAIAPTHLARYLGPLVEWKMDRGVPSQIFNLEQVLDAYGGRDDAERLHNFLQDLYFNQTDGTPQWLLLAGDADRVPVRYLWADRDHSGDTERERNLYVGDTYYSGLESDWDADGDNVFGEPGEEDLTPELYVGRISASLPEEMQAAVAKTLAYELDPPGGDWFENAFLAGALMDEPNRLDDPFTLPSELGYSDEGFDPYTDNGYEVTQKVRAVLGEGYDIIELNDYPYFEGCQYTVQEDTLHRMSSTAAWNRGNALVFWASHGYEAFGGLAEYAGDGMSGMFESAQPFITWDDTIQPNTGGMLPLVYISSCYAGQFDKVDSTNFEAMITVPRGGAIALVAGDGDTFRLENISYRSFGNWWLSERFWQLVVDEGRVRPGEALYTLKHEYHVYYWTEGPTPEADIIDQDYFYANLYAYNLQGDPEVPVWMGQPRRLALDVLGGAVVGSAGVRVRVTDNETGDPVEGARVHARGAGLECLLEAVTGHDGVALLKGTPTELGGELRLAATMDNWVPARAQHNVTAGVRDLVLTDEGVSGPTTLEFLGQVVEYEVTVSNAGDFSATDVVVRFDSGDASAPDEEGVDGRFETRVVDLAPGEAISLAFHHRYSAPGQYDVGFTIDPDDRYPEEDEQNNLASWSLLLRPLPGLPDSVGPIEVVAGRVHEFPVDLDFYVELPNGFPRQVFFELEEVTAGLGAWIDEDNNLLLRPGDGLSGPATVAVAMYSEGVFADMMTVLLDVARPNGAPSVLPVPDQQVRVGSPLDVFVNATDPDGDALSMDVGLPGATFDGAILRWTPTADHLGVRFPTVTVTDGHGGTAVVRFRLEVTAPNSAPTLQTFEDEVEVERGEVAHIPVGAVDADGDRLRFYLASPDRGFTIEQGTGLVTFDSAGLEAGSYSTMVVVTDGEGAAQRTLTVEVEGPSAVPAFALLVAGMLLVSAVAASFLFRR